MKKEVKKIKELIIKNKNILFIAIPFLLMDLFTRGLGHKINFFGIYRLVPNLFTLIWIALFLGVSLSFKKKIGKTLYIIFFILSFALFIVNNVYYSMTDTFFDFSLILLASEGSSYFMDAIINCNIWVYVLSVIVLGTFIYVLKFFPKQNKNNYKRLILVILVFTIMYLLTPLLLGKKDVELTWSTWRNPRNIYINFNDNNKSMRISGFYEYNIRNFYITFLKPKKTNSEEELKFLHDMYNMEEEKDNDKYTGLFKGKNLILLQLEGVDTWMLTKENTPTLYNMMMNGINFTNHYSYYNGGGSTFNSEFAVNTGFITPLSFTQNAYSFSKSTFPYTLARLFKNEGYAVNAFHMNTSEFYSRGANYKNWGYDNYYGLIDLYDYKNKEYELDRELILNEDFSNKMFENDKFVDYIITYSSHLPFSTEKGVCKTLITMDALEELGEEKLPKDYTLPVLNEEECAKRQAKETDYMVELLLNKLEEKSLLENTVIVVYTDHYLYTLSDQTILDKYKDTKNNLINHTPFFIYDGKTKKTVKDVTSQLNILPTVLNLYGIDYNPVNYLGKNALAKNYNGYVFFSDYSWYDGNVYVEGGVVTNNKWISSDDLENMNYYIGEIIKKNDITLKTDYFKKITTLKENTQNNEEETEKNKKGT